MSDLLDDDTGDEKPKKKQNVRDIELLTIRNVMSTMQGRAMFWRLLSQGRIFVATFSPDSHVHAHNAGRREQGLWLDAELREASIDFYHQMLRENS